MTPKGSNRVCSHPRLSHEEQVRRLRETLVGQLRRVKPHRGRMKKNKWNKALREAQIVLIIGIEPTHQTIYPNQVDEHIVTAIKIHWLDHKGLRSLVYSDSVGGSARHWILKNFPPTIQELENAA